MIGLGENASGSAVEVEETVTACSDSFSTYGGTKALSFSFSVCGMPNANMKIT